MNYIPTKEDMYKVLADRVGENLQNRFLESTVAVCGLGGLGSNIAISLARAGIGNLILIDFDKVDISNLNRQQYKVSQIGQYKAPALADNIKEIAAYVKVRALTEKIDESNYKELLNNANVICEAFDVAEEKSKLVNMVLENMPDKYLVAASGMAGLESGNKIITRRITNRFYLCGDSVSDIADGQSLFSSRVMLCAAHQAHMVLRIIAEKYDV